MRVCKYSIELRNDSRYESLSNAGIVALAMLVIAILIAIITLAVSYLFAAGKNVRVRHARR